MKLVIEHSASKRIIEGTFNICGSRIDLQALAEQIELRLKDESWSYGWMTVYPLPAKQTNRNPIHWDAGEQG